ncbi:MAG: protein-L-isoaspartate O-methyltransferase [Salinarimonas sp.]|nr:protein-L-isoaspartate O-methyltransferase [Salinarimonas sp.]
MIDYAKVRRMMVDNQLRTYDISDHSVLSAMNDTPREIFAPADLAMLAYSDRPLVVATGAEGETRHFLAPMVFARMLQNLDLQEGEHLLIIAGALGYEAAVASRLGVAVSIAEPDPALAEKTRENLARAGVADVAIIEKPFDADFADKDGFDAILVNAAVQQRPEPLLAQLADGGRLVTVMGDGGRTSRVTLFVRSGDIIGDRPVFDAAAQPLNAFREDPGFVF